MFGLGGRGGSTENTGKITRFELNLPTLNEYLSLTASPCFWKEISHMLWMTRTRDEKISRTRCRTSKANLKKQKYKRLIKTPC